MSSPVQTTTFGEIMLRVAVRLGWAAQGSTGRVLPTQATTLDDLRSAVNDAMEWFWNGGDEGRKWRWLSRPVTIALAETATDPRSINGSSHLFLMGADVAGPGSGVDGAFWFAGTSSGKVRRVGVSMVDNKLSESPGRTGYPTHYALDMADAAGSGVSSNGVWTLKVFPKPDASYTLSVPVRRAFTRMSDPAQAVPWPKVHDRTIVLRAIIDAQGRGSVSEGMDLEAAGRDLAGAWKASTVADSQIDGTHVGQLIDTSEAEEREGVHRRVPSLEDCTDLDGSPAFST